MDKEELKEQLKQAIKNNTLMIPKHNPNMLHNTYDRYRTVLSPKLASNLDGFIESGEYDIEGYNNINYPGKPYVVIKPYDSSFVPASGILPYDDFAAHTCDCIIAVSGTRIGWHLYGERSQDIQDNIDNGQLIKL
ncbi:MAG TPA: hypothetical protein DCE80_01680 [Ignavibacteriales bacterium]|nr:hypothetical protein [Ignavibacteriales bacterium]